MERPVVGLFNFASLSTDLLRDAAMKSIQPGTERKAGGSERSYRSYLAGRAAISFMFSKLNITGYVAPHPQWGYPQVVGADGNTSGPIHLNVSHSEDWVAVALAESPIGIDIERLDRDASRVMERVSTAEERKVFGHNPILLWTAKEAISKALGVGMTFGMRHFMVEGNSEWPPFRVHSPTIGPTQLQDPAVHFFIENNYCIALCATYPVILRGWDIVQISPGDLLSDS